MKKNYKVNPKLGGKNKIPGCIKKLNQYIKNEKYLFNIYFANDKTNNLLKNILKWKKSKRDNLIHQLEKNYDLINDHDKLKSIADECHNLMRSLNTIVMRWKKMHQSKKSSNKYVEPIRTPSGVRIGARQPVALKRINHI
jgi:hypothetical protein